MKLLNGKGRLFGKINIVDFLIIVLILAIIPTFFCIYKILGTTPRRVPFKWIKVEVVTFTLPEIADLFEVGDVSLDSYGNPDGKIVKIVREDARCEKLKNAMFKKYSKVGKGYVLNTRYIYRIPVLLELELLCSKSSEGEQWYYDRKPFIISLDHNFVFFTDKYSIAYYAIRIKE